MSQNTLIYCPQNIPKQNHVGWHPGDTYVHDGRYSRLRCVYCLAFMEKGSHIVFTKGDFDAKHPPYSCEKCYSTNDRAKS